jgi:hypothetical protein
MTDNEGGYEDGEGRADDAGASEIIERRHKARLVYRWICKIAAAAARVRVAINRFISR